MSVWQKVINLSFCLLFIAVPLIFLPQTSELFEFNKIIVTYIFTIVIVGSWFARMIVEKRWVFKRTPLDWPIIIFLASSLISTLASIDIHTSIYGYYSRWNGGLLSLLSYSLLYWAFVSNMTRETTLRAMRYALYAAVIVAIYGGLEHFGWSPSCLLTRGSWGVDCWVQDVQNRVFATLGQPNWLAAYIAALIYIPISYLFPNPSPKLGEGNSKGVRYWFNLVIFLLLFAALLFTKSRSGLLAFGISAIVFWGITLLRPPLNLRGGSEGALLRFGIWCLVIATLIFSVGNPLRDLVLKKSTPALPLFSSTQLESGGTESGSIRKIVWTGALRIWSSSTKNLLIGTGPETFAEAYYQFRPVEHNQTSEWELLYNKAHNEFLNYLATTGLLGLVSYLVLLGTIIWNFQFLIFNFKSNQNFQNSNIKNSLKISNLKFKIGEMSENNMLILALFTGWVSISVTNFWGFSVVITQLFLFLFPATAIALERESGRVEEYKLSQGQIFAILLLAATPALLLLYSTFRYFLADVKYASGLNAVKSFQATSQPAYLVSAYQNYSSSFSLNPAEPAISSELSVSAGYLANSLHLSDATSAGQLAQIAVAASDKAIATSPHHPNYYKSRARTMILLSDIDAKYLYLAAEALQKAAELSPTDPRIPYNLGVIYNYMAATPSAIEQFNKSLQLKPDFADPKKQLENVIQ